MLMFMLMLMDSPILEPHPLLAQVPLTVSPFINLPTPVTLPYTFKSISSTLPPSITVNAINPAEKSRYVVSLSGEHAAHPDEVLASCRALESHLKKAQDDARASIKVWEDSIKERDLAEKRRVAPGWLDREEKLLQPSRATTTTTTTTGKSEPLEGPSLMDISSADQASYRAPSMVPRDEGEELDRAFGGLNVN